MSSCHSHSHGGPSSSSSTSGGASEAPCDYCAAVKAHGDEVKAEKRRIARLNRVKREEGDEVEDDEDGEDEYSEDEEEEDEQDKRILPGQRVDLPISHYAINTFTCVMAIIAFKIIGNIVSSRTGR